MSKKDLVVGGQNKIAIPRAVVFIDAGFLNKQARRLVNTIYLDFLKMAESLVSLSGAETRLLRAYYYDCPPFLFPEETLTEKERVAQRQRQRKKERFFRGLELNDRIVLRRGRLITGFHSKYSMENLEKDLLTILQELGISGNNLPQSLHEKLEKTVRKRAMFIQKGVDSRLITDLVSLCALEKVATVVLISNDSDFAPALKFAVASGAETILAGLEDRTKMTEHMLKYVDLFVPLTKEFLEQFIISEE